MSNVSNTINRSGGTSIIVVANYSALPDPTTVSGKFYWAEASQGTSWLPGSLGGTYYNSGMYYSNGVSWTFMNVPYQATQAEVNTGTNNDKFVTPSTLKNSTQFQYLDATSPIQPQLDARVKVVHKVTTPSTAHTGTTAQTQITGLNFSFPANTYLTSDYLRIASIAAEKTGVVNICTIRIKINSTNNYATATTIMTMSGTAAQTYLRGIRTYKINGGNLKGLLFTANAASDLIMSTVGYSTTAFDATNIVYGFVSIELGNAGDSVTIEDFLITN